MNKIEIYKHLSWKIKYEAGDMPYPPVMFWKKNISKNDILGSWKNTIEYIKTKENNHNMWLYVHIPFCYTHCFFCTCITKVEHNEKKYDDYLDLIEKESELFSNIFSWVKFNTVYVWWWTPTILSAKQIDRFYNIIKKYFDLSEVIQIMTEWSPYTTTEDKMKILSKHWINKMTFWVQSLDTQTLKTNNRFQQFDDVKNAVDLARKYGIEYINLDIMAWIPWQDLDGFKETIDLIKTLNPTTVHVNAFMPTKNTNYIKAWGIYNYENIKIRNEMELYWKFLEDDRSKITDLWKDNIQLYNSHNFNSSILWLWYWAISHAFWQLHYTKNSFPDYKNFLNNWGKGIFFTWYKLNLEDEIITYFINNLRKWISYDKFYTIFWIELKDTFIYRKILFLIDKWILININKVIKFSLDSDVFCSIYSKYLYKDEVIKNFLNYFFKNQKDYKNLDLMLKQFFTN